MSFPSFLSYYEDFKQVLRYSNLDFLTQLTVEFYILSCIIAKVL
ncbi:hypothetical protein OZD61_00640 [Wolbachia endosymbiont of Drosophila bocki]|nr:hypothetical protein [Wolbachia endosymbiont of Drosophila bocki]